MRDVAPLHRPRDGGSTSQLVTDTEDEVLPRSLLPRSALSARRSIVTDQLLIDLMEKVGLLLRRRHFEAGEAARELGVRVEAIIFNVEVEERVSLKRETPRLSLSERTSTAKFGE